MPKPAPVRLEQWSVYLDPFKAPESCDKRLVGRVYGHKRHKDGKMVTTSRFVAASGRVVTTASGTVYRLGRICPKYRAWLRENGIPYDSKRPVRVKGK